MQTRRAALRSSLAALPGFAALDSLTACTDRGSMGLVIHSFPIHVAADRATGQPGRFANPSRFLEHARGLGAGGIQVGIGARTDTEAEALRQQAESAGMYVEGIVSLPRDASDAQRFESEIQTAKRADANIIRTVMLSGRRYETFGSLAEFRAFADRSFRSLELAVPIVERHDILLAVENHKDWHADELIAILKRLGSGHVGVCLDTGNSIALLEDAMEVVEALAPLAFTTHFKDMGVEEYAKGFLLSEVTLGTGVLDLARIVRTVRASRPNIRINLEMITRNPLEVPCLEDRFWATFPDLPGRCLARTLSYVRSHPPEKPLPRVSGLDRGSQLQLERRNVEQSLVFARRELAL